MLDGIESKQSGFDTLIQNQRTVWLLGKSFDTKYDVSHIKSFLESLLWFTYRKSFASIDWKWADDRNNPIYFHLLKMFQDKKSCLYSIQQIAQMGVSEGKETGEWMGPNTVAHVLKKLSIYDEFSDIAIHVAMDNVVIIDDITMYCNMALKPRNLIQSPTLLDPSVLPTFPHANTGMSKCPLTNDRPVANGNVQLPSDSGNCKTDTSSGARSKTSTRMTLPVKTQAINQVTGAMMSLEESFDCHAAVDTGRSEDRTGFHLDQNKEAGAALAVSQGTWRPLLLVVPLRLGLTTLNPNYVPALKEFFMLKQCLGIIGGRPNHALYFVGIVDEDFIFLDPHVCQSFIDFDELHGDKTEAPESSGDDNATLYPLADSSYHCKTLHRMPITSIDPSLALAFYCHNQAEFENLCKAFRQSLLKCSNPPLFELMQEHPPHIPPFVPYTGEVVNRTEFMYVEPTYDSDEEFEILM